MSALRLFLVGCGHVRPGDSPSLLRASGQESPTTPDPGNYEVFHVIEKLKQRFHDLRLDFSLLAPRVAAWLASLILLSGVEYWKPIRHKLAQSVNTLGHNLEKPSVYFSPTAQETSKTPAIARLNHGLIITLTPSNALRLH